MKAIVAVKRVVDFNVRVRPKVDGTGVDIANLKMSINPFDEIAVEEAVQLKEAGSIAEVIVVSMGSAACQETVRTALAMGADRGIVIETEAELQPLAVAKLLAAIVRREEPMLVFLGKQAIDDDACQTGPMLAALLDWPQATCASKISIESGMAVVTQEMDKGLGSVEFALPAVVTADLRLNAPRYATLPNIMKAKKKPLDTLTPEALGIDASPRLKILKASEPPKRNGGVLVPDVKALVEKLRNEAKVI